jgi:ferredoxin--NADP+ reductase
VAIVGNGNVAMDALRLLVKERSELVGSDVDDGLLDVMRSVPIGRVDVVGRSNASNAKFDLTVLRELGQLSNVDVRVGETAGDDHNPVLDILRDLAARREPRDDKDQQRVAVTFHFGQSPTRIGFADGQTVLDTAGTEDPSMTRRYEADSVVTAVGFTEGDDAPRLAWEESNVWRVGWLSRGARGTIPENRRDAKEVSDRIGAALRDRHVVAAKPGLAAIWPQIAAYVVEFEDWRRLDEHERLTAPEGRCRRKVTDIGQMVGVAAGVDRDALQLT